VRELAGLGTQIFIPNQSAVRFQNIFTANPILSSSTTLFSCQLIIICFQFSFSVFLFFGFFFRIGFIVRDFISFFKEISILGSQRHVSFLVALSLCFSNFILEPDLNVRAFQRKSQISFLLFLVSFFLAFIFLVLYL